MALCVRPSHACSHLGSNSLPQIAPVARIVYERLLYRFFVSFTFLPEHLY